MREGLRNKVTGHTRSYLVRDALIGGRDEALYKAGRPTCTEQEILSWVYLKNEDNKPNKEQPDPKCDEHGMDCWREDEVGNFVHGYGKSMAPDKEWAPNTYGAMYDRMRKKKKDEKRKGRRYSWERM